MIYTRLLKDSNILLLTNHLITETVESDEPDIANILIEIERFILEKLEFPKST